MPKRDLPSVGYLRQRLRYEPDTGKLYWLSCPHRSAAWNARYAGREAFSSKDRHGYRQTNLDGSVLRAHRVAWVLAYGEWPEADIDHVNHDRADNRLRNLRKATRSENLRNTRLPPRNTSGVCGVSWSKKSAKWRADIHHDGKQRFLGHFDEFDDAVAARKAAERQFGFHENHGIDAPHAQ